MSKTVHVDTWFGPLEDFPPGTEIKRRYPESNLVCSDDDTRAYVREDFVWLLFRVARKQDTSPDRFELDCVHVHTVTSEKEAFAYLEGEMTQLPPNKPKTFTATGCTLA